MKKLLVLIIAIVFTISVVGISFAADVKGTATKIEITVKDAKGKETKVEVKDTAGAKVGDMVVIKDGKVTVQKKPEAGGY